MSLAKRDTGLHKDIKALNIEQDIEQDLTEF